MSKEFITWAEVATKSGKSNNRIQTEWATKAELIEVGAKASVMQNYALTDFVADDDVIFEEKKFSITGIACPLTGMVFTDGGEDVIGIPYYTYTNEHVLIGEVTKKVTLVAVTSRTDGSTFTYTVVQNDNIELVDAVFTPPGAFRISFNVVKPASGTTHRLALLFGPEETPVHLIISFKIH